MAEGRAQRGLEWLLRDQERDGSWFGRWGANYVYGTGAVLPALAACGLGEHPEASEPVSTGSKACRIPAVGSVRIFGRIATSRGVGAECPRRRRRRGLSSACTPAGWPTGRPRKTTPCAGWSRRNAWTAAGTSPLYTGTGFPGDFYLNYHLYRDVFPVMALGRILGGERMTGSLLVLAPLRIEHAVLGELPGASVLRTGMGPDCARIAAARALGHDASALAVAGLCAGIAPDLRAGDVICATEILRPGGASGRPSPGALLVAALRRRGLRVHVGPLVSTERILGAGERRRLEGDALAVDMESAWLADGAAGRPLAVVRVVADAAGRRLADPRMVLAGARALRSLRRTSGAIGEWARAIGPRTVLLAGPRSFCAGVERAIDIVELALAQRGVPVYVRKQIVHNEHVVADLERRGAVFVDELDEVPRGATVVFSAHGVSPQVRRNAGSRELDVIDATCPLVSKVHAEARNFAPEGRTIFLIGHEGHEEVEGTMGEAPDAIRLVEDIRAAERIEVPEPDRVSYLTQTTLAVDETDEIVAVLRRRFPMLRGPASDDICYATANRQHAVRAVARDAEIVLVAGSQSSSNSKRLVEVAQREGARAYLVDDETEVDVAWLNGVSTVAITAGASAPERIVTRLVDALAALGPVDVHERTTITESRQFRLPKEVARA